MAAFSPTKAPGQGAERGTRRETRRRVLLYCFMQRRKFTRFGDYLAIAAIQPPKKLSRVCPQTHLPAAYRTKPSHLPYRVRPFEKPASNPFLRRQTRPARHFISHSQFKDFYQTFRFNAHPAVWMKSKAFNLARKTVVQHAPFDGPPP